MEDILLLSEQLKKSVSAKSEQYAVLDSLAEIFYSLHVINLLDDTVTEYNSRDEVKEIVNHKEGAALMMSQVMSKTTSKEHKKAALQFSDLTTLRDRMQNKKVITGEFIGNSIGWFTSMFIAMDVDEEGKPIKVIHATRIIDEEKKEMEKLIRIAQTDELTGFYNRRTYESHIDEHNNMPDTDEFAYISFDVNGLKVVNDTLGHVAGDELIIGACNCIRKAFGDYGFQYRLGGDEFVAIVFVDDKTLQKLIKQLDANIEHWSGKLVDSLSISYGYVSKREFPNASVRELASTAEKRMYDAKAMYYHTHGVDRRGQQAAHVALYKLYTKILKINLTQDTYQIINMNEEEQDSSLGFASSISKWLYSFGTSGQVHPDDLEQYLKMTNLAYMQEYFKSNNSSFILLYRRRYGDIFKRVMMEIIPTEDYTDDNQDLFLYVKNIDK